MNKIIIIGAGNVGGFISYNIKEFGDFSVLGFLDDDPNKHENVLYGTKVLGDVKYIETLSKQHSDLSVVIGIADPKIRKIVFESLSPFKLKFPAMVSKNAWISQNVSVGEGAIIYPGVSINFETEVGNFTIVNMNCAVGHNCTISNFTTLGPSVSLAGFTYLEPWVDMGISSATIQKVRIGSGSRIGGMAMVINDIGENCTAVGVPARVIKSSKL